MLYVCSTAPATKSRGQGMHLTHTHRLFVRPRFLQSKLKSHSKQGGVIGKESVWSRRVFISVKRRRKFPSHTNAKHTSSKLVSPTVFMCVCGKEQSEIYSTVDRTQRQRCVGRELRETEIQGWEKQTKFSPPGIGKMKDGVHCCCHDPFPPTFQRHTTWGRVYLYIDPRELSPCYRQWGSLMFKNRNCKIGIC